MFALLAVSGCASLPETRNARSVEPRETPTLKRDEILVFGRILFTENGKPKAPYGLGKPLWQLATPETKPALGEQSKRKILPFLSTRKDGVFAYVIPAGRYEITHVEPLGYLPHIDPALEFDANEPGLVYYLGDLEVDIEASIWLGGLWGNYITRINHLEVRDRHDETRAQFEGTAPGSATSRKALLFRIHGRPPQLKEQFIPPVIHK
jgi:hypothetical protein